MHNGGKDWCENLSLLKLQFLNYQKKKTKKTKTK